MLNVLPSAQDKNSSSFSNQSPLSLILRASATPYYERFNKKKTSDKKKRKENSLNYVYKSNEYLNNNKNRNNINNKNNNDVFKKNHQNNSAKNTSSFWSNPLRNNKNNNKYNNKNNNDVILPLMVRSKSAFTTQQEFFSNNYKNYSNINSLNNNNGNFNILSNNLSKLNILNNNHINFNNIQSTNTHSKQNLRNLKFPSFNEDKHNDDDGRDLYMSSETVLKSFTNRNVTFLNRVGRLEFHNNNNNRNNNDDGLNSNNTLNNSSSIDNCNTKSTTNSINNAGNAENTSEDEQKTKSKTDKMYKTEKKKLSAKANRSIADGSSLAELDKTTLRFNGVLSLDTLDKSWPIASLTSVSKMIFKDICITDTPKSFNKIRSRFPNAVNFHFTNNNITFLHHLHLFSNLRRIESLHIDPSGNPIVTIDSWVPYAIYRLGFLGLRKINDKELTTIDFENAHNTFSFLTSSIHLLPSCRVNSLLGDRKKHLPTSQLSWSSHDQRITIGDFKTEPLSRAILNCDWLILCRKDKDLDANSQTNVSLQESLSKPPSSSSSLSKKSSKTTNHKLNIESFIRDTLDGAVKKHHKVLYLQLVWREKFREFLTHYLKEALTDNNINNNENSNNNAKNNNNNINEIRLKENNKNEKDERDNNKNNNGNIKKNK